MTFPTIVNVYAPVMKFCSTTIAAFPPVLEHHVAGRDSRPQIHLTLFDNAWKTIAVGCDVRNFARRMRDVRIVGVGDELDHATTTE